MLLISCQPTAKFNSKVTSTLQDSISTYINRANDKLLTVGLRKEYTNRAFNKTKFLSDSLKLQYLDKIANSFYKLNDHNSFKNLTQIGLDFSIKFHDTLNISKAYWKLGFFYHKIHQNDSAFFYYSSAYKSYADLNNEVYAGRMLLNMATIQERVKDYTGAEINSIKAISKLSNSKQYRSFYLAHNLLGVVYKNLNSFDLSIRHHEIAIDYLSKYTDKNYLKAMSLNNIGRVLLEKNNYFKALQYFNEGIGIVGLFESNPKIFAMLTNNIAYSKFKLGLHSELPALFYKALQIRDSLQIVDGIIMSNLRLSEFYLSKHDTVKAIRYAVNAEEYSKKSRDNNGLLESYILMSTLKPSESGKYFKKYKKLSDSLQQQEREIREKFTRIAYETDEITKEKDDFAKRNWLLTLLIIVGGGLFTAVYFYIRQRSKNKELIFNQKQEEANTEIYNLMISEKTKFQEGSLKERNRISEELHDGIVNKLFGTRLSLSLMNSGMPEEKILQWDGHIESLREIEDDIRTLSHELKVEAFNITNTFEKMVEELVDKRSKLSYFEAELDFDIASDWENIPNNIKIHCYRTLQEALQNIHKYAKATKVGIRIYEIDEVLNFEIIDNGIGFDAKKKTNGIGLKNIESRIGKLNGEVKFISSQGNGTKIVMEIPIVF